jgi:hypothetical protein
MPHSSLATVREKYKKTKENSPKFLEFPNRILS